MLRWECPPHHKRNRIMVADTDYGRYMARKNETTPFYTASITDRLRKVRLFGESYPTLELAQEACRTDYDARRA